MVDGEASEITGDIFRKVPVGQRKGIDGDLGVRCTYTVAHSKFNIRSSLTVNNMDPTEKHVYAHLVHRGYSDIVYEPDGNIAPDFLLNESVAVEARRLNQNQIHGFKHKGLEETSIPLAMRMIKLLGSFGSAEDGESWYVFYRFARPIEWSEIEITLHQALAEFKQSSSRRKSTIMSSQSIEVDILKAPRPRHSFYVLGGSSDQDSGGWLLEKLEENIIYCAKEKWQKISDVKTKYPVWWLALVDHIGFILDELECDLFVERVSTDHELDKILIIDAHDESRYLEL